MQKIDIADEFSGDVETDYAVRQVYATDNSVYRVPPAGVIFPRNAADVARAMDFAARAGVSLTARGGGTGTNAQSLTEGFVLDTSRHMRAIGQFDQKTESIEVEPGVVLDQLNAHLAPLGYFFPPAVSTASRATIGGMFATDASGQGSRRYGRTSDHVVSVEIVTADGRIVTVGPSGSGGVMAAVEDWLVGELQAHSEDIRAASPEMNRGLTGYNLGQALSGEGDINFVRLLAGSEGTLAVVVRLTIKLTRLATHRTLSVIAFDDTMAALSCTDCLIEANPLAIEFIDDKVIALASQTPNWAAVSNYFPNVDRARGFLFVEFTGYGQSEVDAGQERLKRILAQMPPGCIEIVHAREHRDIESLWEVRKLSVGLLGKSTDNRQGIAFVEDAAVPQAELCAFVDGFRRILESHGLDYAMYGHADVGCIHVRPLMNMRDQHDRDLLRTVSDAVANLCRKHGGLLWGEHGKGVRGEFVGDFVGEPYYRIMQGLKRRMDPDNRLNPGKLVTPFGEGAVIAIDAMPFRGARDAGIVQLEGSGFEKSVSCNGNGACFHWSPNNAMCPSYKATRDRVQSPKGRASLVREWMFLRTTDDAGVAEAEAGLKTSLDTCLSCNSCTGQCPVQVNVPEMKSRFLEDYYDRHERPLRDFVVKHVERLVAFGAGMPALSNVAAHNPVSRQIAERVFGLVDLPRFSARSTRSILRQLKVPLYTDPHLSVTEETICLVVDALNGAFDTAVLEDSVRVLRLVGFQVLATPLVDTGKALHVRGYRDAFRRQAQKVVGTLRPVMEKGARLVALDPAIGEALKRDYRVMDPALSLDVLALETVLEERIAHSPAAEGVSRDCVDLLLHCTEASLNPMAATRWQNVFDHFGIDLIYRPTGCCGMSGMFGHEAEHRTLSRAIFDLSWAAVASDMAVATGFSCRSQSKRYGNTPLRHPVSYLAAKAL